MTPRKNRFKVALCQSSGFGREEVETFHRRGVAGVFKCLGFLLAFVACGPDFLNQSMCIRAQIWLQHVLTADVLGVYYSILLAMLNVSPKYQYRSDALQHTFWGFILN